MCKSKLLSLLATKKIASLAFLVTLAVSTSCSSFTQEDAMKVFVESMNADVGHKNINSALGSNTWANLEDKKEVQPGVMEYFFVRKPNLFVPTGKECRYVYVVTKNTGIVTGWRYNTNPDYCTLRRQ